MINTGKKLIRFGILFLSISFIAAGVYQNEIRTVFNKATNICLECIGIG